MAKNLKSTNKKVPLVSVVMPVYNCEQYVAAAIESILKQSFKDFEFIIINDGSRDETLEIIKSYKDPRIVLISRPNKGLVASLNEGIKMARGKYIARQDGDDVSAPRRLELQITAIEQDPKIGVLGGSILVVKDGGSEVGVHPAIIGQAALREEMCLRGPFAHGAALGRREVFTSLEYNKQMWPAEDTDLWERVLRQGWKVSNIPDVVYTYRDNASGISRANLSSQEKIRDEVIARVRVDMNKSSNRLPALGKMLGGEVSKDAKKRIVRNRLALIRQGVVSKRYVIDCIISWLKCELIG